MKDTKKSKAVQIINEIQALLEELKGHFSASVIGGKRFSEKEQIPNYSGASGGIRMLLKEGYFVEVRSLPEVTAMLRQEGFNYPRSTISMALLRSVQARLLVRLPAEGRKGREKWVYVIRK